VDKNATKGDITIMIINRASDELLGLIVIFSYCNYKYRLQLLVVLPVMKIHPVKPKVFVIGIALVFLSVRYKTCCILSKNLKQNDGQDKTCPSLPFKNHATYL
jgi:hypothetical protein